MYTWWSPAGECRYSPDIHSTFFDSAGKGSTRKVGWASEQARTGGRNIRSCCIYMLAAHIVAIDLQWPALDLTYTHHAATTCPPTTPDAMLETLLTLPLFSLFKSPATSQQQSDHSDYPPHSTRYQQT